MAYSLDDISQFGVAGEEIPLWQLKVLTLLGVVGSILTMHLLVSSDDRIAYPVQTTQGSFTQDLPEVNQVQPEQLEVKKPFNAPVRQFEDKPQKITTFVDEEAATVAADIGGSLDPSVSVENNKLPATSQVPPQVIAEQKLVDTMLLPDTSEQLNDIEIATAEPSAKKSLPTISQQAILQQPINGIQIGEVESESGDCPPIISFNFASEAAFPKRKGRKEKIKQIKDWMHDHPQDTVLIAGHTSSSGDEAFNLQLSDRRAKAVMRLLLRAGIAQNRLKTHAYGELIPVPGESTSASRINRRVSLQIETTVNCLINEDSN